MGNRHETMLQIIQSKGQISIAELKKYFPDISEMTIRRDIDQLEQEKQVLRIHGGVKSITSVLNFVEDRYAMRSIENQEQKLEIAQKAVSLIKPKMCIFLDSGSTTTTLAQVFPDVECIVYTTGLTCALELARLKNARIVMVGGWVNPNSLCTYGSYDIANLRRSNFDLCLMGVTGYTNEAGFTTGLYDEAELKRTALQRSQKRVILMDSQKIGKAFPCTFAEPEDMDVVISDKKLDEETKKIFLEKEIVLL